MTNLISVCLDVSDITIRSRASYAITQIFGFLGLNTAWVSPDNVPNALSPILLIYSDRELQTFPFTVPPKTAVVYMQCDPAMWSAKLENLLSLLVPLTDHTGVPVTKVFRRPHAQLHPTQGFVYSYLGQNEPAITGEEHVAGCALLVNCSVDLVFSTFFFLSRIEETGSRNKDRLGRFFSSHSVLVRSGLCSDFLVNQYIEILQCVLDDIAIRLKINGLNKWYWPDASAYAACLTHDVDHLDLLDWRYWVAQSYRCARQLLTLDISGFLNRIRQIARSWRSNQGCLADLSQMNDAEKALGFSSTYYMLGGPRLSRYGAAYRINSRKTREFLSAVVAQGNEVGLHGGYRTGTSLRAAKQEKKELEAVSGVTVTGNRQHYLSIDIERTWQILESIGITHDASIGYSDRLGSRVGCILPYLPYVFSEERPASVLELPLAIMDASLFASRPLNSEQPLNDSIEYIERIRKHSGLAVLLWHNLRTEAEEFPGQFKVYKDILSHLHSSLAWVASAQLLSEWWSKRQSVDMVVEQAGPEWTWKIIPKEDVAGLTLRLFGPWSSGKVVCEECDHHFVDTPVGRLLVIPFLKKGKAVRIL